MGEAFAILDVVKLAKRFGHSNFVIESDSECLIKAFTQAEVKLCWEVKTIASEVKELLPSFSHISFSHVRRQANQAADWFAKTAKADILLPRWCTLVLADLNAILLSDVNPTEVG